MSIERLDFENLSEDDLAELVQGAVPEGLYVEYKRELYGNDERSKHELRKDVSAFANTFGGHLFIGIEADQGGAAALPGASGVDPDQEVQRLEQLIRSGIEPTIEGLRVGRVAVASGGWVFAIRVPRSWNVPHRVSSQNTNPFYVRHSAGVHEASMEELRAMFTLGSTATEQVRKFHRERVADIKVGFGTRPAEGRGRLILHIVPLAAVSSLFRVDLQRVYQLQREFEPIGDGGMSPQYNLDGFRNVRGGGPLEYTQIFRNGILEASRGDLIRMADGKTPGIPGGVFERSFT